MKEIFGIIFLLSICIVGIAQENHENKSFGNFDNDTGFWVLTDNKLQIYKYDFDNYENYDWQILGADLNLPNEHESVLSFMGNIGVLINNKIQLYRYDICDDNWKNFRDIDINLPTGWEFAFNVTSFFIGVVINNNVQLYAYTDDSIRIAPGFDLNLPAGWESVFYVPFDHIGVVVDNKVRFYKFENTRWQLVPDIDLNLPNSYKSVFYAGGNGSNIGVVTDNKIQFYNLDNNSWEIISEIFLN